MGRSARPARLESRGRPGWAPRADSELLAIARVSVKDVLGGEEPDILAIHAGIECGIIAEKCPGSDIVSFGPTIRNALTPKEALHVETVAPFWEITRAILHRLAERRVPAYSTGERQGKSEG